jgi:concanavalin A-like lectin/glucanase superfamily protein
MTSLTLSSLSRSLGLSPRRRAVAGVTFPIVQDGLIAEWRLDDGAGQSLTDYSGNDHHGQLGSTAGADVNDPAWQSYGLSFDGDDSVALPGGLVAGNHAISWFAVVTAHTASGFQIIALGGDPGTGTSYDLAFQDANIFAGIYGGTIASVTPPALPYSVAGVYEPAGPSTTLYLNGAFNRADAPGPTPNIGGAFMLGAQAGGGLPLQGGLAFVALHDIPLSAGQAAQMHTYAKALLAGRGVTLP